MQDFDFRDPSKYPSTVKPFAEVAIGEDCETFDGRTGVVLNKGTVSELFDGQSSTIALALESGELTGEEDAILVQLLQDDCLEPVLFPYSKESAFVRKVFSERD